MGRRVIELVDLVRRTREAIRPNDLLYLPPAYCDLQRDAVVRLSDGMAEFRSAIEGGLRAELLAEGRQAKTLRRGEVALRITPCAVAGRPGWNHAYCVQVTDGGIP